MRKNPLVNDQYYHIVTRSIAKFKFFNNDEDYFRIIELLNFYRFAELPCKYSKFTLLSPPHQKAIFADLDKSGEQIVAIVAYCIMPTHIHLILKQLVNNGISKYMRTLLDSYSKYFNIKHDRKGPLYECRFKNVLIESDEQMLHVSRYVHLNAVTAGLVKKPQDWKFSSYQEYIGKKSGFCQFDDVMDIKPKEYRKFVCDHIAYQKELSRIKHLLIDNYTD